MGRPCPSETTHAARAAGDVPQEERGLGRSADSRPAGTDVGAFRAAGTSLARIFLVQILFYAVIAVGSAVLNARGRYFADAWSPALANLVTIALVLLLPLAVGGGRPGIGDVASGGAARWLLGLSTTLGIGASAGAKATNNAWSRNRSASSPALRIRSLDATENTCAVPLLPAIR